MGSIDIMFEQLTVSSPWASTIAGFILVLIILFSAIAIFGKNKVELGAFGFLTIILIGTILATVLGLFPPYIMLILLGVSLIAILMKAIFFGGTYNG